LSELEKLVGQTVQHPNRRAEIEGEPIDLQPLA
jgi:hypothetical protein